VFVDDLIEAFDSKFLFKPDSVRATGSQVVRDGIFDKLWWERIVTTEEMQQETYHKVGHDGCLV